MKTTISMKDVTKNKAGNYQWKKSVGQIIVLKRNKIAKPFMILSADKGIVTLKDEMNHTYNISTKNLISANVTNLYDNAYENGKKPCKDGYTDLNVVPRRKVDGKFDWVETKSRSLPIPYEFEGRKGTFTIKNIMGHLLRLESNGVERNCYETEVGRGQLLRFYQKVYDIRA